MPVGLPPNTANLLSTDWINDIRFQLDQVADYFQIPSFHDVYAHAAAALHDSVVASKSIYVCVTLTTRPLCILIGLVSHYLCVVLKVLADCTIQHLIIALREGWRQAHFAVNWFVNFQNGLSRAAVLIEVGVICLLILLCAVQRYIKRKKYAEKIFNWYKRKRRAMLMKYEIIVDSVAQTSLVLALLLPHILYSLAVISVKYFAPTLFRYLATKTILTDFISIYYPIIKTILVVHRWVGIASAQKKEIGGINNAVSLPKPGAESKRNGFLSMFRKKSSVTDKYLDAALPNTPQGVKGSMDAKAGIMVVKQQSYSKFSNDCTDSEEDLTEEVTELLKYWSVYAFMTATCLTFSLLPVIGRIFSTHTLAVKSISSRSRLSLLGRINISQELTEEIKLVFFVWLNLLPTSSRGKRDDAPSEKEADFAINNVKKNALVLKKKMQASHRMTSRKNVIPFTSQPLDMLYERLSPWATSLVQSSTTSLVQSSNSLYQKHTSTTENSNDDNGNHSTKSIVMKAVSGFRSILDILVWSKIISDRTKCQIIAVLMECLDLMPALSTLFMPSYFTSFGVVYVRLVVPGAKSAQALNALKRCSDGDDKKLKQDLTASVVRYLRYWVIHFILLMCLTSFSPILDWIPLVTHMTWIMWAYVHLESSTLHLYSIFSRDLMAFGLLNQHTGNSSDEQIELDINDTVVAKLFQAICKRLPSGKPSRLDDVSDDSKVIQDDKKRIERSNSSTKLNISSSQGSIKVPTEADCDMSGLSIDSELDKSTTQIVATQGNAQVSSDADSKMSGLSVISSDLDDSRT